MAILLVAEKINDPVAFIKLLREGTELSISEIRSFIATKKPFLDSSEYDNDEGEVDELIQVILDFAKSKGDTIKIIQKFGNSSREITEEIFHNLLARNKDISKCLEELDEEMYGDEDDETEEDE